MNIHNKIEEPTSTSAIAQLCCGQGQHESRAIVLSDGRNNTHSTAGTPYGAANWNDIVNLVKEPMNVPKGEAWWVIPSTYRQSDARTKAMQLEHGEYWLLPFDIDAGNKTLQEIKLAFDKVLGPQFMRAIYSTKSATTDNKKWRCFVALGAPLVGIDYQATLHSINNILEEVGIEVDRKLEDVNQLVYLPNEGDFYEHSITGTEPMTVPPAKVQDVVDALLEAQSKASFGMLSYSPKTLINEDGSMSAVVAFNMQNSIEAELEAYGCKQIGFKFLAPSSESGNAGINILPSGCGPWSVAYCHNESETALYGRICDPAEVHMQRLLKDGKATSEGQAKALLFNEHTVPKEYADVYGVLCTIDEYNKRVKMQPEPEQHEMADGLESETVTSMPSIPKEYFTPDDEFGDLVKTIYNSQRQPNIMSAFCAAMLFVSTVAGGHYCGLDLDDRLRVFIIITGHSGAGKETLVSAPAKVAAQLVYETRKNVESEKVPEWLMDRFVTPSASPEGLQDKLINCPDIFCSWDEIAMDLKSVSSGKATHKAGYLNELIKLHSKADTPIRTRDKAANGKQTNPGVLVYAPHICVSGASTEDKLANSIDDDFLRDGSGARFNMFECSTYQEQPRRRSAKMVFTDRTRGAIARIINATITRTPDQRVSDPIKIKWGVEVEDMFYKIATDASKLRKGSVEAALKNRQPINAKAFAMCRALMQNTAAPVVDVDVAKWGCWLAEYSDLYKMKFATNKVSFGGNDKAAQAVVNKLSAGLGKGVEAKWFTQRDLKNLNAMRVMRQQADAILNSLVKDNVIEIRTSLNRNKLEVKHYRIVAQA